MRKNTGPLSSSVVSSDLSVLDELFDGLLSKVNIPAGQKM